MDFSVGVWPGNGARSWRNGNKGCIFFLGRGQITQAMADEAVMGYVARRKTREDQARKETDSADTHQGRSRR
jgi:hypothetical protein